MIEALVFDFDGLILETEEPDFLVWQDIYRRHGVELPLSQWSKAVGTSADAFDPCAYLEELCGRPVDRELLFQEALGRYVLEVESRPILPGVLDYLSDARAMGLKLAVASTSSRDWVQGHLTRLGLWHHFDCVKTGDDVTKVKPDPELYIVATKELGVRPQRALALEDSPNGILAAKRAGLYCVAVPNALTRQLPLDHADLRINSLAEVPLRELLARLEEKVKERDP